MQKIIDGNLLIAHGGGPTAVINASLKGAIGEAKKHSQIKGVFGARFGLEGIINENFIDLSKQSNEIIKYLAYTPASALGSCRKKIVEKEYPLILEIFKKFNIRYFLYNGGNDSMDTCHKIFEISRENNFDLKVIGIPKTIDNDLEYTDHSPGYGSAARYAAISTMELSMDVASLPIHVCILELMGRNTGWITAASVLAKNGDSRGPHLIYLPERPFCEEQFLEDVKEKQKEYKGVLVVVSEGLADEEGKPLTDCGFVDGFGHKIAGGVGQYLSDIVIRKLGIKSRSEKPGLLGRVSMLMQSGIDREEAIDVGAFAVRAVLDGESGYMVSIKRVNNFPYKYDFELVPLIKVANNEKKFPGDWINDRGNWVEEAFKDYCKPLIGGELPNYEFLDLDRNRKI
jgi:6-phosphofructokinase 1